VTPPTHRPAAAPTGLLEKLLGVVRPEFRVDVYVPDPGDPVLGRPICSVPGCDRSGWEYGLCTAHGGRWRAQGRPELTVFVTQPGPELNGRRGLSRCTVTGCRFGTSGLCCRNCFMGPCRVIEGMPGQDRGICGATASTIVARNFARMIAAGTAAHSDHGRDQDCV